MTAASNWDIQSEPPCPNGTLSFWHGDPSEKLLGHRTTEDLPSTADVVVIGSGITGTFAARELVAAGRRTVMVEAREACWGATGRNGGHCQPGVWNNTPDVARFELATFRLIAKLVAEHDIPCDWKVVGGIHSIYSDEVLAAAREKFERLQQCSDLTDHATLILDNGELAARNVPEAIAAVYQPNAAACWPYKLVAWLLERLLTEYDAVAFNLQTNTLVERLERNGSSWAVHTQRGKVVARDVLLASNAYTSYLLPRLTGLITPLRAQVCALELPPGGTQLPHSYVWLEDAEHQYLIHRGLDGAQEASTDKYLIFGGQNNVVPNRGLGISRDDVVDPVIGQGLRRGLNPAMKLIPGDKPEPEALVAAYEWTGIMGYSRDGAPWVGRVPDSLLDASLGSDTDADGLWISAGYTGHGMPVAPGCGITIARMILGKERDDGVDLPQGWTTSEERVAIARSAK
ncbi:putative FAD dependent oxidoreductase [Rosellinia necatrix]|uniref:Putative FAD dependent oxidoreductase n=1 Tax=Rosellinia necatrix TaxID=77044 RepID=A0A1W2TWZ9_ROSNE|nr:putative FAD dependent oxidoreductase [Rosellinia necatrix]